MHAYTYKLHDVNLQAPTPHSKILSKICTLTRILKYADADTDADACQYANIKISKISFLLPLDTRYAQENVTLGSI